LLFLISDNQDQIEFNAGKLVFLLKRNARYASVQIFYFFQKTLEDVIWPIYIFLTFNNIFSVGVVGSLMGAGSCFFMIFVGRRADITNKKKLFKIGGLFLAMIWIFRFLLHGELYYYILTICAGFFGILASIPFEAYTFTESKKENIAEFMIFRESLLFCSRLMAFGMAFLLVSHLDYAFIAAALSNLFFLLL